MPVSALSSLSPADLIAQYHQSVDRIEQAIAGMTLDQLKARPQAGKWSALEVLAHLTDAELALVDRIQRALVMPDSGVLGWDENQYVARMPYHGSDAAEEVTLIRLLRRRTAKRLATLSPEQWRQQVIHNQAGPVTIRQLVEKSIAHADHHLAFVAEKRRLMGMA